VARRDSANPSRAVTGATGHRPPWSSAESASESAYAGCLRGFPPSHLDSFIPMPETRARVDMKVCSSRGRHQTARRHMRAGAAARPPRNHGPSFPINSLHPHYEGATLPQHPLALQLCFSTARGTRTSKYRQFGLLRMRDGSEQREENVTLSNRRAGTDNRKPADTGRKTAGACT
jgi:hypothetical protein